MSESTTESNNPKPLSDRIFLIIMAKYDVLFNKVNPVWKRITKLDSDYQIVTRARFGAIVLFPCVYLYIILHRLSEHNFEYLKACTKEKEAKYIDLFIIEPCLFYDVACGFFFLFLLIDVGQKLIKRYKITNNQFVFLLVLELSYCIVRGQSWNDYALTHFERWTSLYYADIIWLFGLYLIFFKCLMTGIQTLIKCLSDTIVAKKEKLTYKSPISNATPENILTENNNQGFQQSVKTDTSPSINKGIKGLLYDKKSKDDTLHRKPFAEQLANRILATNNPEGSVAVAVTGEWASGKSTFLGYIREYLEGKAIIIDMNAGATESKRLLVKDFFDTIAEELQSYDAAVSELVYDYVDSLLEVHENGIIKVLKKVFAFNKTNSTKERFKTLSGCIKQLHQPLIIFIDDLDRLDKKETKEVLRLIRNTANFSNVIYIVAFDKDYVIAQIKTAHDETGKYLDKLFQLEVSLPFYESNKITDYLFKVLEERFGEWHTNDIKILKREALNFQGIRQQTFIGAYLNSYRDVHRLVNSFTVIYDCFKHESPSKVEIDFCDLFLLEVIRLNDSELYREIYHWDINALDMEFDGKLKSNEDKPFPYKDILNVLVGGADRLYRLREIDYFYKYFRFRISEGDISGEEILKALNNQKESKEDFFLKIKSIMRLEIDKNLITLRIKTRRVFTYSESWLNRFVHLAGNYVNAPTVLPFHVFEKSFYCLYHIDRNFMSWEDISNLDEDQKSSITDQDRFLSDNFIIDEFLLQMLEVVTTANRYEEFIRIHQADLLNLISSTILDRSVQLSSSFVKYVKIYSRLLNTNLSLDCVELFRPFFDEYKKILLEKRGKNTRYEVLNSFFDVVKTFSKVMSYFDVTSVLEKLALSDSDCFIDCIKILLIKRDEKSCYFNDELIDTLWGGKEELKIRLSIGIDDNPDSEVIEELQCFVRLLNESRLLSKELVDSQYSALSFIFDNGID
jgi:ABC-type lipoprotein export system ATPase subunit